jgi:WhiB family redox-sensing transcriptional regulator
MIHDTDTDWMVDALCRHHDPEFFFPPPGTNMTREQQNFCCDCPVRDECLEYAIVNKIQVGIWGGLSHNQRKPVAKRYRFTGLVIR